MVRPLVGYWVLVSFCSSDLLNVVGWIGWEVFGWVFGFPNLGGIYVKLREEKMKIKWIILLAKDKLMDRLMVTYQ